MTSKKLASPDVSPIRLHQRYKQHGRKKPIKDLKGRGRGPCDSVVTAPWGMTAL